MDREKVATGCTNSLSEESGSTLSYLRLCDSVKRSDCAGRTTNWTIGHEYRFSSSIERSSSLIHRHTPTVFYDRWPGVSRLDGTRGTSW